MAEECLILYCGAAELTLFQHHGQHQNLHSVWEAACCPHLMKPHTNSPIKCARVFNFDISGCFPFCTAEFSSYSSKIVEKCGHIFSPFSVNAGLVLFLREVTALWSPVHMPLENVLGEEERECVIAPHCAQKARHSYHTGDFLHTWCHTSARLEAVLSSPNLWYSVQYRWYKDREQKGRYCLFSYYLANINLTE